MQEQPSVQGIPPAPQPDWLLAFIGGVLFFWVRHMDAVFGFRGVDNGICHRQLALALEAHANCSVARSMGSLLWATALPCRRGMLVLRGALEANPMCDCGSADDCGRPCRRILWNFDFGDGSKSCAGHYHLGVGSAVHGDEMESSRKVNVRRVAANAAPNRSFVWDGCAAPQLRR
jgi:hypothetical protein